MGYIIIIGFILYMITVLVVYKIGVIDGRLKTLAKFGNVTKRHCDVECQAYEWIFEEMFEK